MGMISSWDVFDETKKIMLARLVYLSACIGFSHKMKGDLIIARIMP